MMKLDCNGMDFQVNDLFNLAIELRWSQEPILLKSPAMYSVSFIIAISLTTFGNVEAGVSYEL